MKKILVMGIFLLAGVMGYGQSVYSERLIGPGIEKGDVIFSVLLGGTRPAHAADMHVQGGEVNANVDWGSNGGMYGLSGIYFPNAYLGYGMEINGMDTTYASKQFNTTQIKTAMDVWSAMLSGRLNINPHQSVRLYVPAGVGLSLARSRWRESDTGQSAEDTYLSVGYFIGAGIETNLNSNDRSIGLEVRYTHFGFDKEQFLGGFKLSGQKNYGYLALLLKLNYRF